MEEPLQKEKMRPLLFHIPLRKETLELLSVEPQAVQRGGRITQPSLSQTAASSATRCILVGRGWKLLPALLNVTESVISSALMRVVSYFPLPVPLS